MEFVIIAVASVVDVNRLRLTVLDASVDITMRLLCLLAISTVLQLCSFQRPPTHASLLVRLLLILLMIVQQVLLLV